MELFPTTKASDPLPGNWSYDSANDLFFLNPVDMNFVLFDFGDITADPIDPCGIPTAEGISLSSEDLGDDDQSWLMSTCPSIDVVMTSTTSTSPSKASTRASSNSLTNNTTNTSALISTSSTRWSCSPEIKSKEYIPTRTDKRRKARSLFNESSTLSAQAQAQGSTSTQVSAPKDPQDRNDAKRAAHNIIEKRYRTNISAKFLALEKAIYPAGVQKSSSGRADTGTGSLKKSEILSSALTYIECIQQENLAAQKELSLLKQKELSLLKQGIISGAMWKASKPGRS